MKKYLFAVLLLTQVTALADAQKSVALKIGVKTQDVFKVTGDRATGTLTTATVSAAMIVSDGKETQNIDLGSNTQTEANKTILAEISNKSVRMIDDAQHFDQTIPADVSLRGFFTRKVTQLRISADVVKAMLSESLKKKGETLLLSLGIKNEQASVQYNVNISDYVCTNQDDNLTCDLNAEVILNIQGK